MDQSALPADRLTGLLQEIEEDPVTALAEDRTSSMFCALDQLPRGRKTRAETLEH